MMQPRPTAAQAMPLLLTERVLFVKQCHAALRDFVTQFEQVGAAQGNLEIEFGPARLAVVGLVGLLRGARRSPTELLQIQQLIVEHRLPDIIALCTREPFRCGRYPVLKPKTPKQSAAAAAVQQSTMSAADDGRYGGGSEEPEASLPGGSATSRLGGGWEADERGYFSTDSQGLLGEQNWAKVRGAEGQGGVLHGFLTECYLLLKDTAAGNMANKLYISQFIIGDHWENFYSHCWHGLGAARLLAEIFADNLPLQVTGGLHRCNRCNRGPTCNRCNRCR